MVCIACPSVSADNGGIDPLVRVRTVSATSGNADVKEIGSGHRSARAVTRSSRAARAGELCSP